MLHLCPDDSDRGDPATGLADQPITDVQTQLGRVDTKASILFGLSLAALTGGTAVAGKAALTGPAVLTAVAAAGAVAVALVLLGSAIRPNLAGSHGFIRWAAAPTRHHLRLTLLADQHHPDVDRVAHLLVLSRLAVRKYRRVQRRGPRPHRGHRRARRGRLTEEGFPDV
jgi:hypothetical protein